MLRTFVQLVFLTAVAAMASRYTLVAMPLQNQDALSESGAHLVQTEFRQVLATRPGFLLKSNEDLEDLLKARPELASETCDLDCASAIGLALEADRILLMSVTSDGTSPQLEVQLINPATKRILQKEVASLSSQESAHPARAAAMAQLFDSAMAPQEEERRPDATSSIVNRVIGVSALVVLIGVLYLLM